MAYSSHLAAALSGCSLRQLAYWRSSRGHEPLLPAELATDTRAIYSFRDVIALRTVAYLREDVSLQKIRQAVANLRDLGNREHLSRYRLVASGRSIIWVVGEEAVDLVLRPGQQVMAQMSDVLAPFVNARGLDVPDLFRPRELVSVDQDVLAGYPVIAGTRVPFDAIASLVADGVPPEEIDIYYPQVSADAAEQAHDYARYVELVRGADAA